MPRLAVARFWYKGNAFSPLPCALEPFRLGEWSKGEAALAAPAAAQNELAAVAAFRAGRPDWHVDVLRCASALPAGPLEDAAFDLILEELLADLRGGAWDGVYLSLHGAVITPTRPAADLDLISQVRNAIGATPLAASFDLEANLHPSIAELLDVATARRSYTYTPSDLRETGERALRLLAQRVDSGRRPRGAIASTGLVLPGFRTSASEAAMTSLLQEARAVDSAPVLDVSLLAGFPYADTRDCAAKVMVWTEAGQDHAQETAQRLAAMWQQRKGDFRAALPGPHVALAAALKGPEDRVAVLDCADDPWAGGPADTTAVFRALLDLRPSVPAVFSFFVAPEIVAMAHAAGAGAMLDITLGAQHSREFGAAIPLKAQVTRCVESPEGRSAVVTVDGIQVIVSAHRPALTDPAFFALHGIDLARTRLLVAKGGPLLRAAFAALGTRCIECDAPGPASVDLRALPFRTLRTQSGAPR